MKIKQTDWLLWVAKKCDWLREITALSKLNQASLVVEYKESRIELRKLQISSCVASFS